jgi:hypothetical protein
MKLAVIDLDGVVADATARFAKAEEVKQQYLASFINANGEAIRGEATNLYWRTVFNPENVSLDTLIKDAKENLETLRYKHGYELMFLTSRPDTIYAATLTWLFEYNIVFLFNGKQIALVMKPPAAQYVKTITWKALTIQMLVALYGADEALIIDDEPANLAELAKYDTSHMRLYASLAQAIAPSPDESEDHPF